VLLLFLVIVKYATHSFICTQTHIWYLFNRPPYFKLVQVMSGPCDCFTCSLICIGCSDGLMFFENLPYEAQNLDSAGPESLRQLDVEVAVGSLVAEPFLV